MPRHLFVVYTNAVAGREHEYNDWYKGQHVADLLACPGVVSARRFELAEQQLNDKPAAFKYLALYEVETDDPQSFLNEITTRAGTANMPITAALAQDAHAVLWKAL